MAKKVICHDCGCGEGELHERGCDMERCPFCGHQLISCGCRYKLLGYKYDWNKPLCGLSERIYNEGLDDDQEAKWGRILSEKGRVPYLVFPNMCARCGKLWPEMFHVPDEEWEQYVPLAEQHQMLCQECYDEIKELIRLEEKNDD